MRVTQFSCYHLASNILNLPDSKVMRQIAQLTQKIKNHGIALGFQAIGISDTQLTEAENQLMHWLASGKHGTMFYMEKHGKKRTHPSALVPGTCRI
ncbi:MAG TPA: hypothetical protein ENK06_01120, partial [Gammaproteobacteria bacterium]|nr:hypothetical protein [Gammaproteobacteria bacterium]